MILGLMLLGCAQPVDPLAAQREALAGALEAPLEAGWAPHATLVLGRDRLDELMLDALSAALEGAVAPVEQSFFGLTASMSPTVAVDSATVMASEACESCLSVSLTLRGGAGLALENATGRKEQNVSWSGTASGTAAIVFDAATRRVMAELVEPEAWGATVAFDEVPAGWNSAFSQGLSSALQAQVARPKMPSLPLVQLKDDPRARLKGIRLRGAGEAIAVDFAFALAAAGVVLEALPDPEDGWVVVVPQETALGMLQAAALRQPFDAEAPVVPELVGLHLSEGFELDVLAWPTSGRGEAREVTVFGDIALADDGIAVSAERAELAKGEGALPDLAALLYGDRVLGALTEAMSLTLPSERTQTVGGVALSGQTTSVSTVDGVLVMSGGFVVE